MMVKKTRFQGKDTVNLGVNVFFRLTSFGPLASYQKVLLTGKHFSESFRNSVLATICKKLIASAEPFSTDSTTIRAVGAGVTCMSS